MNIDGTMTLPITLTPKNWIWLSIVIIAALSLTFFYSLWQWHDDWKLAKTKLNPKSSLTKTEDSAELIAKIPAEHLFGVSLVNTQNMPITNLQLRVTGIVKVDSPQGGNISKAYISVSQQPSKIFYVNDVLSDGVKIFEIGKDTVILEINGHFEKLPLPRTPLQFKSRSEE